LAVLVLYGRIGKKKLEIHFLTNQRVLFSLANLKISENLFKAVIWHLEKQKRGERGRFFIVFFITKSIFKYFSMFQSISLNSNIVVKKYQIFMMGHNDRSLFISQKTGVSSLVPAFVIFFLMFGC